MAKKPSLSDVTSVYTSAPTLNNNNRLIEDAFQNTLSRDGSTPNEMEADLDLNNNDLLNVKHLHAEDVYIEGEGPIMGVIQQAEAAADKAQDWAESATEPGDPGTKSAKTWAGEAGQIVSSLAVTTPEAFGAVGDGVTDDRDAIVAAAQWLDQQGGGVLQFANAQYNVAKPIRKPLSVRFVGKGRTQFLQPSRLVNGKADLIAQCGTRIFADRDGVWPARRGVVESVNETKNPIVDAGLENIIIDANEAADHAIVCLGVWAGNYRQVMAGWSRLADWPCGAGPAADGVKTGFSQAKFDNCSIMSIGREVPGSQANYLGGWLFFGDTRREADDGEAHFQNANLFQMSGCFGRTGNGNAPPFVFEDSDSAMLMGCTGPILFHSADTYTYGVKSVNPANNYSPRHHTVIGHQGNIDFKAARTPTGRAPIAIYIVTSSDNGVGVSFEGIEKSTPPEQLASAVADSATVTIAYPEGTARADFNAQSTSGTVKINSDEYTVESHAASVSFGASSITVTNASGVEWPEGATITVSRLYPNWKIPRAQIVRTGLSHDFDTGEPGAFGGTPVTTLLGLAAAQNIANAAETPIRWSTKALETEPKFWNSSEPEKLTVPAGIRYVEIGCGVVFAGNATGRRTVRIRKNGGDFLGMPSLNQVASSGGNKLNCTSGPVPVKEGDQFTCLALQNSGGDLDVTSNGATWISIKAW